MDSLDIQDVKRVISKNIEFDNPKQKANFLYNIKRQPNAMATKLTIALCKNEESTHVMQLLDEIKKKNKRLKNKLTLYILKYGEL